MHAIGYVRVKPTYQLASAWPLGCIATLIVQNGNPTTCVHSLQLTLVVRSADKEV